jgi:hypothetical protein
MTADPDVGRPLSPAKSKTLQQIIGVLLYYGRAVDSSILVALGTLASAQTKATTTTTAAALHLLDYLATHPNATIRYRSSPMILSLHSDAFYLSESESRSRVRGIAFLSSPKITAKLHVHSSIMKMVLASTAEAEVGALFFNAQDACNFRQTLLEIGHPQPPTAIQTDNACAHGIMSSAIKQKRSKAIGMRFYWLRDRIQQLQFNVYWAPGYDNHAD